MLLRCAQEFPAQINPAPEDERVGVQVPPLLAKLRDDTLRCMFCNKETMLECTQVDSRGVEYEPVFDEPPPMVMKEYGYGGQPRMPAIVKYMLANHCYMRVWSDSSSLFFGPVMKDTKRVADLDER